MLWVLRACAGAPIRVQDEFERTVRAVDWVETLSVGRRAFQHTWLVDAGEIGPERLLWLMISRREGTWGVRAEPARDGVYHDLPTGSALTVRGGANIGSTRVAPAIERAP
jgi:hypothetical protein